MPVAAVGDLRATKHPTGPFRIEQAAIPQGVVEREEVGGRRIDAACAASGNALAFLRDFVDALDHVAILRRLALVRRGGLGDGK